MSGFRGFRDKARFDFPAGFVVLTGRNGSGKSTVLDAIEFALTGALGKYDVKNAKGGGLVDHIWWMGDGKPGRYYVRIGLTNERGEELEVEHDRESGLSVTVRELREWLCSSDAAPADWLGTLLQTSLIRDERIASLSFDLPEQARATAVRDAIGGLAGNRLAKRADAVHQAALAARKAQAERVAKAQNELGRALTALTEARSVADRQGDVAEATAVVEALSPEALQATAEARSVLLRKEIAVSKQSAARLESMMPQMEAVKASRDNVAKSETELESAVGRVEAARLTKEEATKRLALTQAKAASERADDPLVAHLVALLKEGEEVGLQEGRCPLCSAERSAEEFHAAIARARSSLADRGARVAQAEAEVAQAQVSVEVAATALAEAEQCVTSLDDRRRFFDQEATRVAAALRDLGLSTEAWDVDSAKRAALGHRERAVRLERALYILEASSANDRVVTLERRVEELRDLSDAEAGRQENADRVVELAKRIDAASKAVVNELLNEQFDTVMPLLKELYRRLRPHVEWCEIESDFGGRVRASLNFTVGEGRNPQFLFSSGQRRAAGLAFLLSIHLARPWCRLRSLLLDDPVQHVDDYRALNLVEVLSAVRRTSRQVIIAVEDPALAEVLCRRLRSTVLEGGRRFDLHMSVGGSAVIGVRQDILPMARDLLVEAKVA